MEAKSMEEFLTAKQLMEELHIKDYRTLWAWLDKLKVPIVAKGRCRRVRRKSFEEAINKNTA